jgi:hypothetical protein
MNALAPVVSDIRMQKTLVLFFSKFECMVIQNLNKCMEAYMQCLLIQNLKMGIERSPPLPLPYLSWPPLPGLLTKW